MYYNSIFIIPTIISLGFIFIAAYSDCMNGIIPNRLNFSFLILGLFYNLVISLILNDFKLISLSLILMTFTFILSFLAWKLKIWGGGDVKLFTAIASTIPVPVNLSFLTGFLPEIAIYPFIITIMINSILCSFPFLVFYLILNVRNNSMFNLNLNNLTLLLDINFLKILIKENFNKETNLSNLKEGMVLNNYYFNNFKIFESINERFGNLSCYINNDDSKYSYYFKSDSISGISSDDLIHLKILHSQKLINNSFSIKKAFPFAPSILLGFIISIIFGDMILILLNSLKLITNMILC
ncbi:MAG: A24 family peptidase [Methanobacteriaceae archaeon]|jgi:preflagellin peptidase FlaK|nr:A24 family peptidase [Methanobacteriaceae archaeon]